MELKHDAYFGGEIESSSHKNERENIKINIQSPRENHSMALLDLEKKKIKDASNGENLLKAPKDGRFNLPILEYQEISMLLVEEVDSINVGVYT